MLVTITSGTKSSEVPFGRKLARWTECKSHRIPGAPNLPANHPNGIWRVFREILLLLPNERGFADAYDFCRACDACSTVCRFTIIGHDERGDGPYLRPEYHLRSFRAQHHLALPLRGCGGPTSGQA